MLNTHISVLILLLPLSALAAPARSKRAITPIYDGSQVNGKTYDYVIAGGGLAGSVLASRLTEDAGRTVLIIESGYDEEANSAVTGQSLLPSAPSADEADATAYQQSFGVSPPPYRKVS